MLVQTNLTDCVLCTSNFVSFYLFYFSFKLAIQLIKHVFQYFCKGILKSLFLKILGIHFYIYSVHVLKFVKIMALLENNVDCICRLNLLIVGCSSNSMSMYAFGVFPVSRLAVPAINVDKVIQTFFYREN